MKTKKVEKEIQNIEKNILESLKWIQLFKFQNKKYTRKELEKFTIEVIIPLWWATDGVERIQKAFKFIL